MIVGVLHQKGSIDALQEEDEMLNLEEYEWWYDENPTLSEQENNVLFINKLCLDAKKRHIGAIYKLAMLADISEINICKEKVYRLLLIAHKLGHPHATWRIALLHLNQGNEKEGKYLLLSAAQNASQGAMWSLAEFYAEGLYGFHKNERLATFYNKKANSEYIIPV